MKKIITRINATWVMVLILLFTLSASVEGQTISKISKQNLTLVKKCKPKILWEYFQLLSESPRCSGGESGFAKGIVDLALGYNRQAVRDSFNNVVVYLPSSPGFEDHALICLQGHIDMVCQARDSKNTKIFPLKFIKEGDTLRATGTTLGADDGLGISAMLSFISDTSIKHGPMELLFTAGEEIGLVGAKGFNYELIKSKVIYNLDSEEEGVITIGCAGGAVMQTLITPTFAPVATERIGYGIEISGFKGGHSGGDIHLGRANAIKVMGQLLLDLEKFDLRLGRIASGSAVNTIPRECHAVVYVAKDQDHEFIESLKILGSSILSKFPLEDPQLSFVRTPIGILYENVMDKKSQKKLLQIIKEIPNGVIAIEERDSTLVRTSNNIGIVEMTGDSIFVKMLFRSSSNAQIDSVKKVIESVCSGQKTDLVFRFAPWEPDFDGTLVKSAALEYKSLFGNNPLVKTTHGGLECAIFFDKIPNAKIISFGPSIHNAHTPDECVEISSVEKFWQFLLALVVK